MNPNFSKKYTFWLYATAVLFFLIGYLLWQLNYYTVYWSLRILASVVFMGWGLFLTSIKIPKLIISFFVVFILGAIFALQFDSYYPEMLYIILNIVSLLLLIIHLRGYLNYKKMSLLLIISFLIALILNGYFVFELIKIISSFTVSGFHHFLYIISGSSILILAFAALFYNHIISSKASMSFLIFSIFFIFYHVFLVMGHYKVGYDPTTTLFIARILLLLSFVNLVRYLVLSTEKK